MRQSTAVMGQAVMGQTQVKAVQERRSQIRESLDNLESLMSQTEKEVLEIYGRISPILHPLEVVPGKPTQPNDVPPSPKAEISHHIDGIRDRLYEVLEGLRQINSRIEI